MFLTYINIVNVYMYILHPACGIVVIYPPLNRTFPYIQQQQY